ncbi:hypothetical protein Droror1_Dr00010373 [Drosera rotundifolia]
MVRLVMSVVNHEEIEKGAKPTSVAATAELSQSPTTARVIVPSTRASLSPKPSSAKPTPDELPATPGRLDNGLMARQRIGVKGFDGFVVVDDDVVQVGSYFVTQYYQLFQQRSEYVHQLYSDSSTMIQIDGHNREAATAMANIYCLKVLQRYRFGFLVKMPTMLPLNLPENLLPTWVLEIPQKSEVEECFVHWEIWTLCRIFKRSKKYISDWREVPTKKGSAINAFSKIKACEEPNIHGGQSYISFQNFAQHNKDCREKPMLMDQQGIDGNSHYSNVGSQWNMMARGSPLTASSYSSCSLSQTDVESHDDQLLCSLGSSWDDLSAVVEPAARAPFT